MGTLVTLPYSSGFHFLIIKLSCTCNRYLHPPPPKNLKSSFETFPHLPSASQVCSMGADICLPFKGFSFQADKWVCFSSPFAMPCGVTKVALSARVFILFILHTEYRRFWKSVLVLKMRVCLRFWSRYICPNREAFEWYANISIHAAH